MRKSKPRSLNTIRRFAKRFHATRLLIIYLEIYELSDMMMFIFIVLTFSTIVETNANIFRYECRRDATFKLVKRDSKLGAVILVSKEVQALRYCAKICVDNEQCKSFNYNSRTLQCEALAKTREEVGESNLKANPGWKHYEPIQIEVQESPACRLKTGPCRYNKKCLDDCTQTQGHKCVNLPNIARGKPTADGPGPYYHGTHVVLSSRAVDGGTDANLDGGSCTHTLCCSPMPWWRVDFGNTALVYSTKIKNRGDCCGDRLSNFNIRIGESSQGRGELNTVCKSNVGVPQGATSTFVCKPRIKGRYLFIQSNYRAGMTLCEVQVFGEIL